MNASSCQCGSVDGAAAGGRLRASPVAPLPARPNAKRRPAGRRFLFGALGFSDC